MNKAIEEAAWDFARNQWGKQVPNTIDKIADMLIDFGNEVMAMPLSDRLTAEEKERVRKMYKEELEFAQFYQRKTNSCCNQQCRTDYEASRDIAKSRANMLESIFGADMFNEKEK